MPSSLLLVLNPRHIPPVMRAIEALPIEKCWLSYMSEVHAADHANAIIRHTEYDRYLVLSDDAIPTPLALQHVLDLHDAGHPVTTGYCNLDAVLPYVNLCRNELTPPREKSYDFLTQADVDAQDGAIPTTFAGFSLTCMSRDMWLHYPMAATTSGGQMDYQLSWQVQCDGIPIVTHRDARVQHVKERWNERDSAPEKALLVNSLPPSIRWSA